ncbi:hypothetical protein [Paenibacillus sp. FSL H3-0333]|uniref:hypothetical protein n=1 Tax=Paenibacillus sp. FSL H3-0333 TaxID=2921373 RepID=UPI0030F4CAE1
MRLRQRDLKPYIVKSRTTITEPDGTTYEDWGDNRIIHANINPAGGKLMAEIYGERLVYMLSAQFPTESDIKESDAICYKSDNPNYKVIALRPWSGHISGDLEKMNANEN